MERSGRPLRSHPTLSKQISLLDDECDEGVVDSVDGPTDSSPTHHHHYHHQSQCTPPPTPPGAGGVSPPPTSNNNSFTHHHNTPTHGPGPGGGGGGGRSNTIGGDGGNGSSSNSNSGGGCVGEGGERASNPTNSITSSHSVSSSNHGGLGNVNNSQDVGGYQGNQPGRSRSLDISHQQRSVDIDKDVPLVTSARHRHHGGRLQRSHAMREDTSPPPEILEPPLPPPSSQANINNIHCSSSSGNTLTVSSGGGGGGGGGKRRLKHQGSSQSSYDGSSPCLSRDSSTEYTDSSGVDLQQFIIQTLHKNQKDRMMLLKIEHELVSLVKDSKRTHNKFPPMSSYQRMLVHRCAAFFGLEHNVDQQGTAVIVNKTRNTRLPEIRFREHCRDDLLVPDEPKRSILKRDSSSFEDGSFYRSLDRQYSSESRRSKSFEEREEEYEKSLLSVDGLGDSPVRSHDSRRNSHDDSRWHESRHWNFMESEVTHRKHHYDNHRLRPGRLPKVESFESRETLHPKSLRPPVFKSHSFGGYSGGVTVLSRGESVSSNFSSSRLSKQDSLSSRISDHSSSSGYKTQRQDTSSTNVSNTLSTTPSPTTSQHQHSSGSQSIGMWGGDGDSQAVMWAVTDMEAVPAGAMLINPQSGQPYMNSDGSVYRFDPSNPPQLSPGMSGSSSSGGGNASSGSSREKESSSHDKESSFQPSGGFEGSLAVSQPSSISPSSSSHDLPPPTSTSTGNSPSKQLNVQGSSPEPPHSSAVSSSASSTTGETKETGGGANEGKGPNEGAIVVTVPPPPPPPPPPAQPSQAIYPTFYQHPHLDSRSFSQEGSTNDINSQMRELCISGPNGGSDNGSDQATTQQVSTAPVHQSYVVPRQNFTQPIYYMSAGSMGNVNGSLKYVYPHYQMAPVQAAPAGVQPGSGVQPAGVQQVQGIPTLPAVPAAVAGAIPVAPTAHPSIEHNPAAALPPPGGNYVPGGYTVVAYPTGSNVGGSSNGQEPSGTTYYYQIPTAAAAAAGLSGPIPAAQPAQTSLQQYTITPSTTTTTFPQMASSMGYYTPSNIPGGGLYQAVGSMPGIAGGMYGTPQAPAPGATHTTTVSYRAPTPPQTPSTQGMNMSLGYVSGSSGGAGVAPSGSVGGQYVALVPPQQPPTPTSHAPPQLFTTFIRPSVQMMGSAGTPPPPPPPPQPPPPPAPPQTILQYAGAGAPPTGPVTPHPPVFAKPFIGPTMHTFMQGPIPDQSSGGGKDDKRLITMTHNMGPGVPATQFLTRPYSIMQSDMRIFGGTGGLPNPGGISGVNLPGGGAPNHIRAGPLIITGSRPRHPNAFTPTPLTPLNLSRPPKVRRQRSRTSYTRNAEVITPQPSLDSNE